MLSPGWSFTIDTARLALSILCNCKYWWAVAVFHINTTRDEIRMAKRDRAHFTTDLGFKPRMKRRGQPSPDLSEGWTDGEINRGLKPGSEQVRQVLLAWYLRHLSYNLCNNTVPIRAGSSLKQLTCSNPPLSKSHWLSNVLNHIKNMGQSCFIALLSQ